MEPQTQFNAAEFLHAVQTDAVESKFTPVPAGEYAAAIVRDSITVEQVPFKDGNTGARFTAQWQIEGEVGGMTNPKVRQQFLLDINGFAANGAPRLKTGANQNVRLGRLIDISGQKVTEWSYAGLVGARAKIKVTHRPDKNDPEIVYAEVAAVAAL
jgi:hypothetical protein